MRAIVKVNYNDMRSIIKAEKEKRKLENKGYIYFRTFQTAFNVFEIVYLKESPALQNNNSI